MLNELEKQVELLENIIPIIIENVENIDIQKFISLLDRLNKLSIAY